MTNNTFVKFILRQIVGNIEFSLENKSFSISLRNLSESIRKNIIEEGRNWGLTDKSIENLINETNNRIDLYRKPLEDCLHNVDVNKDIPLGGIILLNYIDNVLGQCTIKLMRIDSTTERKETHFLLLGTNILSLHINDTLEVQGSVRWDTNHRALFQVIRHGKPYPDHQTIFATGNLQNIILLRPSILYEVIDSKLNFTFSEEQALRNKEKVSGNLSFGKNPMALLLHQYSNHFPVFADFDSNGRAKFYSNENFVFLPSEVRDFLFAVRADNRTRKMKIMTKEKGEILLIPSDLKLSLLKPAQASFTIIP